jgi:hypothetical protein
MADVLGLGITHYPPLCMPDARMSGIMRRQLDDPAVPASAKDPAGWPEAMRAEWSDDHGERAAGVHREALVQRLARVRERLEAFRPDVVLIWGDDQYENFREDVIPAFTVCAYDDLELAPWAHAQGSALVAGHANVWGEGPDKRYRLRGARGIARELVAGLLEAGVDAAYAYKPLHHPSLAHAFTNAILYLDYDRRLGWDWPTIAFPVNCYGRKVIATRGAPSPFGSGGEPDPPSPSPRRCMQVGAEVARILKASPWRVALLASSSWSHAFLCDHTWRLRPDTAADRRLYQALVDGDYDTWRHTPLSAFEHAGQQEVLNWALLMGAMEALGARPQWTDFVETHIFNSNKVFAIYEEA